MGLTNTFIYKYRNTVSLGNLHLSAMVGPEGLLSVLLQCAWEENINIITCDSEQVRAEP